jgi:undecaprenyl-diphosphatase
MDARRLTIVAVLLAACYVVLGLAVSPAPPGRLDVAAEALRGYGVPAALFFTRAGQFPVYAGVCVLLLIAGAFRRAWLGRVGLAVATLLCAWVSSDLGKAFFHRPRPAGWIGIHETSYSYASGHATLSLAFYGFWACCVWTSGASPAARTAAPAALCALIGAIGWSRLALGAHYATDVLGGYLLGGAWLCLALAVRSRLAARPASFAGR